MNTKTFNQYQRLIYEKCGIALSPGKEALLCSRLSKRMRALSIVDHRDYFHYIEHDDNGDELVQLIDAISTNVTHFFREDRHFGIMGDYLVKRLALGQKQFRIWSAACSTGEEPYSMAMIIMEIVGASRPAPIAKNAKPGTASSASILPNELDVKILATDISTRALKAGKAGLYNEEKMKNVSKQLRASCFEKTKNGSGPVYTIKRPIKDLVQFKRLNLSQPPFPMRGPFDLIFCRNVMIYFDNTVRRRLLADMHRLLAPAGYLMVGHSESLTGLVSEFKPVAPSIYTKT